MGGEVGDAQCWECAGDVAGGDWGEGEVVETEIVQRADYNLVGAAVGKGR